MFYISLNHLFSFKYLFIDDVKPKKKSKKDQQDSSASDSESGSFIIPLYVTSSANKDLIAEQISKALLRCRA